MASPQPSPSGARQVVWRAAQMGYGVMLRAPSGALSCPSSAISRALLTALCRGQPAGSTLTKQAAGESLLLGQC